MQTIIYPSAGFRSDFNAAIIKRVAFKVAVIDPKKAAAIRRTIERLRGSLPNDSFLASALDKLRLLNFYPCLADAWLNHRYTIQQDQHDNQLELVFDLE